MSKPRVLFSIPTRHHVEIALDELTGLQELGYTCEQFPYAAKEGVQSKFGRLWVILQNAFYLIKTARKFKPNVIYFNSRLEVLAGIRDFITIAICKTFYRHPVCYVIKSHGSDIDVLANKEGFFATTVLPYLKKNISGWLFLSTEERSKIIETQYFSVNKIYVTKNIVRTGQFTIDEQFKSKLNIPTDHQILLFVGRVIKEKGVYEVVKAFAQITDKHRESTLIIVGSGPELENLRSLTNSLKITDRIIFTGFIPEKEVVNYYANSDILVFPTYFPEGFPMALFNSVAAGMAVVTTPTRAATDYLTEQENCIWVEPKNFNNVSLALDKLLQSVPLVTYMKKNNLAKGIEFGRERVSMELAEILKQIVE